MTLDDILKEYGISSKTKNTSAENAVRTDTSVSGGLADVLKEYGYEAQNQKKTQQVSAPAVEPLVTDKNTEFAKRWYTEASNLLKDIHSGKTNKMGANSEAERLIREEYPLLKEMLAENPELFTDQQNLTREIDNLRNAIANAESANTVTNWTDAVAKVLENYSKGANIGPNGVVDYSQTEEIDRLLNGTDYEAATKIVENSGLYENPVEAQNYLKELYKNLEAVRTVTEERQKALNYDIDAGEKAIYDFQEKYATQQRNKAFLADYALNPSQHQYSEYLLALNNSNLVPVDSEDAYNDMFLNMHNEHEQKKYAKKFWEYNDLMGADDFREMVIKGGQLTGSNQPEGLNGIENQIYNYLYGKNGKDAAEKYLAFLEPELKRRKGEKVGEWISELNIPVVEQIIASAYGFGTSAYDFITRIPDAFSVLPKEYEVYDYANNAYQTSDENNAVSKFIHKGAMTVGNMAPSIALSYLTGGGTLGALASNTLSALSNKTATYRSALESGMTASQADKFSSMVAASEVALGSALDKLMGGGAVKGFLEKKIGENITNGYLKAAANLTLRGFGEVIEEDAQLFLEPAFESLITGKEYTAPEITEILETTLLSFVTSGASEVMTSRPFKSARAEAAYQDLMGDTLIKADMVSDLKNLATKQANGIGGKEGAKLLAEIAQIGETQDELSQKGMNRKVGKLVSVLQNSVPSADLPQLLRTAAEVNKANAANTANADAKPATPSPMDVYESTLAMGTNAAADPVADATTTFTQNGTVTDKQVQDILNSTTALDYLREQTGIPIKGTAEERSNAVRQAVAKLAQQTNAEPETTNADVSTPATDMEAVESMARPSMPDVVPGVRNRNVETPVVDTVSEISADSTETDTQSPTESVGAAPSGFDPNTHLQYKYGTLPEGENPVRSDDLPVSTDGTDRVSLTARTVKGAKVTPDDFVDLLNKDTAEGGMSYIPITNSDTVQNAIDRITEEGWDDSLRNWTADVRAGKAGADLTATGALLLNNAAKAGNHKLWLDILHDYQRLGTNTAQGLQAFRILKTLTPSDKLYMAKKTIKQMVKDMKLDTDITINPELEEAYNNAKTDAERDDILGKIKKDIAKQLPVSFMEKFTALRYLNMLGNLRTQVRNVAGNACMRLISGVKNVIDTGLEAIASKVSNGKFQKTRSLFVSKAQKQAAKADFDNMRKVVLDGGKYNDSTFTDDFKSDVMDEKTIFSTPLRKSKKLNNWLEEKSKSTNAVTRTVTGYLKDNGFNPLEGYRKATNWMMETGDLVFSKSAYARSLAGYLKANGVTETDYSKVDPEIMDKARLFAVKEAQEVTFRDTNALSGWLSKAGRRDGDPKWVKIFSEGVMPLRKTPANVLVRAEEYSPLGIINAAVTSIRAMGKSSDITGAQIINSWSKAMTGTGVFVLGAMLQGLGILAPGPDDDENRDQFDEMNGWQNYAITLPDGTNFTIDFLSPSAIPLLMGAEFNRLRQDGGITMDELGSSLTSLADPMIEMSMLQGVNDTLDDIQYSDNNLGQLFINTCVSYLTQGLTNTFLGQMERSFEDTRMTTYVDKDSQVPDWLQRTLGKASAKIPGWDYNQIPYINAWGEEEKNPSTAANLAYNTLSPAYFEKGSDDNTAKELNRLHDVLDKNVYPSQAEKSFKIDGEEYTLDSEEYVSVAKLQGQTQKELVDAIISNPAYAGLSDKAKAKAIKFAYEYAREYARGEVVAEHPGLTTAWMQAAGDDVAGAIVNHVVTGTMNDSFSALTEDWKNGKDNATAVSDLNDAWDTFQSLTPEAQQQILDGEGGRVKDYITARENGITAEEFVGTYRVEYTIGNAFDSLVDSWKKGESNTAAAADLEKAWEHYSGLSQKARNSLDNELTGRQKDYITARKNGISAEVFSDLYGKYYNLNNDSWKTAKEKASAWSLDLERARTSGNITTAQRDLLKNEMYFSNSFRAKTERFDGFVEKGIPAETASYVDDLLNDLIPEAGKADVSDIQRIETVANADSYLTESQQQAAMEEILPEKYYAKYQAILKLGMDTDDYAKSYRIYLEEADKGGKGVKARTIEEIQKALRITEDDAKKIYEIYKPPANKK